MMRLVVPRQLILIALFFLGLTEGRVAAQVPGVATGIPEPANRNVIIQLFNWRFVEIQQVIPRLKDLGYSHVHVSPPQRSNERVWEWWGRYQPIDFSVISGPLGSEAEFMAMNDAADANGIEIIIDVVSNHTVDINELPQPDLIVLSGDRVVAEAFPQFEPQDFRDRDSCNGSGQQRCWLFGNLADLKTESGRVRDVTKQYLMKLIGLGADAFRFDAAKHIEPGFFPDVLSVAPGRYAFGEIVATSPEDFGDHLQIADVDYYDFPLAAAMRHAFAFGGDLSRLKNAEADGHALKGIKAVTFVRNHDIDRGQVGNRGIGDPAYGVGWNGSVGSAPDRTDIELAYAFILGREDGFPYVFADMPTENRQDDRYDDPDIVAAIRFHNLCLANPDGSGRRPDDEWLINTPNTIGWQRGTDRFIVINKAAQRFTIRNLKTSLQPGTYLEVRNGWPLQVQADNRVAEWDVPERSAMMFVRVGN